MVIALSLVKCVQWKHGELKYFNAPGALQVLCVYGGQRATSLISFPSHTYGTLRPDSDPDALSSLVCSAAPSQADQFREAHSPTISLSFRERHLHAKPIERPLRQPVDSGWYTVCRPDLRTVSGCILLLVKQWRTHFDRDDQERFLRSRGEERQRGRREDDRRWSRSRTVDSLPLAWIEALDGPRHQ